MTAGIEIIGGANLTQDSKVMSLVSKINNSSMSTSTVGSGTYGRRNYTYTFPYSDAIYAVSLQGASTTPLRMTAGAPSSGSTQVNVSCPTSSPIPVFDVYAFRPGGGGPVISGAGIEIYRADGTLGFGSSYGALRPLIQLDYNPVFGLQGGTFSGKRVACIFSQHARELDGTGSLVTMTTPTTCGHFVNNNSSGLCFIDMYIHNNVGKDLPYAAKNGRYMFIDVTNY